jgi:hypothetical protein
MSRHKKVVVAAVILVIALIAGEPSASAQHPPQAKGDPREAIALSDPEVETLLAGMRLYLESIQGIVAAIAENQPARVSGIAAKSGARLLQKAAPFTGLKLPLGFTSMSFDTHDKFDKLADKAEHGASRTEVLNDLRDIMGNCISCHAAYRLAP